MIIPIQTFQEEYSDDKSCIPLLHKLKWPTGYVCPKCGYTSCYTVSSRRLPLYECRRCRYQTSLTTGTIMEKSRTPLHKWLLAMFIVASFKESINAVRLSTLIQVTYKTAWSILNKIRLTISEHDRTLLLCGVIDAKLEVFMSQPFPYPDARMKERSSIIARARNIDDGREYVKLKLIKCEQDPRKLLNEQAELEFIENHVRTNSNSITINRNYRRPRGAGDQLHTLARTVFQWINDTFHGIRYDRAQSYLDEYCFRLNHQNKGKEYAFNSLLKLGVSGFSSIHSRTLYQIHSKGSPMCSMA